MMGYLLVRPKGFEGSTEMGTTATAEELEEAKRKYEAKKKSIEETKVVIDSVVKWLNENDYKTDPRAVSLVEDAVNQLESAEEVQPRIDEAVEAQEWVQAQLWAEQYYQYQVKAADAGVRAKKIISEGGAQ